MLGLLTCNWAAEIFRRVGQHDTHKYHIVNDILVIHIAIGKFQLFISKSLKHVQMCE